MIKSENYIKKYKLIIFDLDGVIIDSKLNMKISWNNVNDYFKLRIPFNLYFKNIGIPFKEILKKIGVKKKFHEIQKKYAENSKKNQDKIVFYKDAETTLKYLKNKKYKIGIVTSKDRMRTNLFLSKLNIKFNYIVCPSKKLKGKPYPDQILHVLKKSRISNNETMYIGDTIVDKKASINANIDFLYAQYGYGKINSKNIKKIKSLNELVKIL